MKKLIQIGLSSLLVFPVLTLGVCAEEWNDKTTSMVTYFPVPYAVYNNIYVSDKFDIGTSTKPYKLYLGNGLSSQRKALEAYKVTLCTDETNADNAATLTMDSDVYTPTAYFGKVNSNSTAPATLVFQNLHIGTQPTVSRLEVTDATTVLNVEELNLFGANLGKASCEGTVQVQQINIGDGEKNYVVCCEGGSCGTACYFGTKENEYRTYCETRTDGEKIEGSGWCSSNSDNCSQGCGCQCNTAISQQREVESGPYKGATYCEPKCETQYWDGTVSNCEAQEGSSHWDYNSCKCVCKANHELDGNVCRPLVWTVNRTTTKTAKPAGGCPTGQSSNYNTVNGYQTGSPCSAGHKSHGAYQVHKNLGVCTDDATQCCTSNVEAICGFAN